MPASCERNLSRRLKILIIGLKPQETHRIVVRGPQIFLPLSFSDRISLESAYKSNFFVCISYESHFIFVLRPCRGSTKFGVTKKASYQGVMIIEMPFALICVMVHNWIYV